MERQELQEKTDNELMELAGRDNREAFETLVLRYYREAIRAAERIVHDNMQAEDIVQDCFADIYVQRRRIIYVCGYNSPQLAAGKFIGRSPFVHTGKEVHFSRHQQAVS